MIDYAKCIGCNMCIKACDVQGIGVYKQNEKPKYPPIVKLSTLFNSDCIGCGQCATICPVDAIAPKNNLEIYKGESASKKRSGWLSLPLRRALRLETSLAPPIGTNTIYSLIRMLKQYLGFDYVF